MKKTDCSLKLTLLLTAITFSACNMSDKAEFEDALKAATENKATTENTDTAIAYAGLTSINKSDSTVSLVWPLHADAVAYDIFEIVSGVTVLKSTVIGQGQATTTITGLTPLSTHTFRVRMRTNGGKNDTNTQDVSVTLNAGPLAPTGLTYVSPSGGTGTTGSVQVRVSGVKAGDTIKLYSNSACTSEIASGVATGATIDLTSTTMPFAVNTVSATAQNSTTTSACVNALTTYTRSCPSTFGSFIRIPHNNDVGTTADFCVMKYEARNNLGDPFSTGSGAHWGTLNQATARNSCRLLGPGYDLISNEEWMTIARNIEALPSNWSNGNVGDGHLSRGWSGAAWRAEGFSVGNLATNSLPSCLYNTGPHNDVNGGCGTSGLHALKRTHNLSNGEAIWDLAGNAMEWVNWQVTCVTGNCQRAYRASVGPVDSRQELKDIDTNLGASDVMRPSRWQPLSHPSYDTNNYVGTFNSGDINAGGGVLRGGPWYDGPNAGIFSIEMQYAAGITNSQNGFRCVYHP